MNSDRVDRSLSQLMRIARQRAEGLQARLSDVEAAQESAAASLAWLERAVRTEELSAQSSDHGVVEFARFLEGAQDKRSALKATCEMLESEAAAARRDLEAAFIELKKLDHLLSVQSRAQASGSRKREVRASDEGADGARRARAR